MPDHPVTVACVRHGLGMLFLCGLLHAETGYNAWLRYERLPVPEPVPAVVAVLNDSVLAASAQTEIIRGLRGMWGKTLRAESGLPKESAIVLGTLDRIPFISARLGPEGFLLKTVTVGQARYTVVAGADDRGVLYGAFALLRKIALGERVSNLDERESPFTPVRWVNQWDRLDGTIERGYGGASIFWDGGHARQDLGRVRDYGRMLASLGINGCSINNVNADLRVLSPELITEATRIAGAFRPSGVRVVLAVDFGSPKTLGGLDTFDPLDERVAAWWRAKTDEIYRAIPDLGGFVLKADSEGRVGPSTYGRTHADAANVVARALKPHGGLLLYRGFVYDHHMDWRNLKNDRARAAYDNFHDLDGKFDSNVIIQIKNGPIDFQVREPVSPLFAALHKTKQAMELQVTQEYTGQARHTVFLGPLWKEPLDFDKDSRPKDGFAGVANVGLDDNWFGNHLSQANLYAFGRLAWNPDLSARGIAQEWTRLTFGGNPKVNQIVDGILMSSWRTYENYTGPLGLQTLTDITGNHYGVNVEASERNGWGQWHRADEKGVGMDRTVATGTGYIGQYPPKVARWYESLETCPDDLLLFLHHVRYTHKLHNGKTVIQYIYDSHYAGADAVEGYVRQWKSLQGLVDEQRYQAVLEQLQYQAGQAEVWRDAVNMWFFRESGVADDKARVGKYPGRFEAESLQLAGYTVQDVTPWEDASGGKAVACPVAHCAAALEYQGPPGWYAIQVRYFDQSDGVSRFRVLVDKQVIDEWAADLRLPTRKIDSTSSTRRVIPGVALRPGDEIRIEGTPDGLERAALDYIEIQPESGMLK